ncbi:MAG: EscU/YscU/HrcU family type III secretion system export apparatus switch protein [Spirochaetaceae bacterium]|jgi:flagellar biosynthesis protein FlhB|nr:EscU/YscU/HrcU family type III secretion system export apparatus switch protein [Spirochaetaceae bacterium]
MRRYNIYKRKTASAIGYDPAEGAPRILASGRDREAERILTIAREAGIQVVEDPALATLLDAGTRAGDYVPSWCWEAVAKILAFVLVKEKL